MSERYTVGDVRGIFGSYLRAAGNVGYDVTDWNLKIFRTPLLINAAKGLSGTDAFEALPGFSGITLGITCRDAYNALSTAARTLQALANDQPQTNTRGLYEYKVSGRYGTSHIDLYYDIQRDGSYKELYRPSIESGSRKAMHSLAIELNTAMHTLPTQAIRSDSNVRYLPTDEG